HGDSAGEEEGRRRGRNGARHPVHQDRTDEEVSEPGKLVTQPCLSAPPATTARTPISATPAGCASAGRRPPRPRHRARRPTPGTRSEEHTSELQSLRQLVCRLLLEKKKRIGEALPGAEDTVATLDQRGCRVT